MKTSTKQEKGLFVLLLIFIIQENISSPSCSIKMCLNCTLGPGILKLTCKIDKLHLPVSFHNNFGKEIAFCSLPFPSPLCISGYKNTTVRQNIHTNETVVTIREIIDQRINGNWSCLHGYGRDMYEADFEINIPISEGQHNREQTGDLLSPKEISWYTIAGISISVITLIIVCVLGIYICIRKVKNVSNLKDDQVPLNVKNDNDQFAVRTINRDMGYAIYKIATVGHLTISKPNTPSKL
ncbi:uncharacterized protein [Mytilus edulis]|uniref:uncharacterized protein n=1 Tax=Mytilus edulis TaxID=6550 RepID=UPI0039EF15A9